jgi:hypothetical protein
MDRTTVLLMACRDMLAKCRDSNFVLSPMETTVFYDDADCDGYCLLEDIEAVLEDGPQNDSEEKRANHEISAEIAIISEQLLNNVRNTGSPRVIADVSRTCGKKLRQLSDRLAGR